MTVVKAPLWTAREAAAATGGTVVADWQVSGVSIDSRALEPGDLFIALKGPNFDGHAFVAAALEKGACAMVSRVPDGVPPERLLVVPDTFEGLRALARRARERTRARIVAITGSVGKTGTKEMLRLALSSQGPTHATEGNLNNHWGLPLSLARMPENTAFGIFEMGMNHPGEIAPLSELARPHVAIITTVEAVHMEFFASTAGIADAKAEIFSGMDASGVAVLNRDNAHFDRLARAALERGVSTIIGFGAHPDADLRLTGCDIGAAGTEVRAELDRLPLHYTVGVAGRQWAINSLAVLGALAAMNAKIASGAETLAGMVPPKGRGARHAVAFADGALDVIDESYNASPVSTAAALATLAAIPCAGRRIAALGDMLELGPQGGALHAGLAEAVIANGIDLVFTAGPLMERLREALPEERRGAHADSAERLAPLVTAAARAGDVIMVKGSAGSRTGIIVRALLDMAATNRDAVKRVINGH